MAIDNFDLYEMYERERARWERNLPVCDICGERMSEWNEIYYKGMNICFCDSCMTHNYYEEE